MRFGHLILWSAIMLLGLGSGACVGPPEGECLDRASWQKIKALWPSIANGINRYGIINSRSLAIKSGGAEYCIAVKGVGGYWHPSTLVFYAVGAGRFWPIHGVGSALEVLDTRELAKKRLNAFLQESSIGENLCDEDPDISATLLGMYGAATNWGQASFVLLNERSIQRVKTAEWFRAENEDALVQVEMNPEVQRVENGCRISFRTWIPMGSVIVDWEAFIVDGKLIEMPSRSLGQIERGELVPPLRSRERTHE